MHKTAKVLDKLPKRVQPQAKSMLHEIWQADSRELAEKAFDRFLATSGDKYPKATENLASDRERLLGHSRPPDSTRNGDDFNPYDKVRD